MIWSDPDAEPLAWFGPPPGALPAAPSFDPSLVERLRIRGLDLEFCKQNYARYRAQQKNRVKGQLELFEEQDWSTTVS